MNKPLRQLILVNFHAILIFSCNSNEISSQSFEGKWLGNIYDYELKKHCAIVFLKDKVYLYGYDLVTIVDSITRKGDYLITKHEYKGKIRGINEQLTCIENLPENQDNGKCDMFYKVEKTIINCSSTTLNSIMNKSSPLYGGIDNNEEFFLSKTIDSGIILPNDEIGVVNIFKVNETYFLIPADEPEEGIIIPIKEINDKYLLAINIDEKMEMKFILK